MAQVVGLDLGSHAVRAARVRLGGTPELVAFGQVGLARGVIEHGEVIDPAAVASAVRRLWREAGIRERRVRVGLANLRTIVRQVEVPQMSQDELRSALEFQAAEFIPLPVEDTLLDFQILETFEAEEGEALMRVLIAAVHRDTLTNALTAVREAGLQPVAADLIPFALVRALGPTADGAQAPPPEVAGPPDEAGATAEGEEAGGAVEAVPEPEAQAIVSVGSGVTVVVVHEDRKPRFVRIVDAGGDDLTEAVADGLEMEFEDAEQLKRQIGEGVDREGDARDAMEPALDSIVNEVRGSIEFYGSQAAVRPVERVLVTGGGVLTDGLLERLQEALGLPVASADPTTRLRVGDIGFEPDQIGLLRPYLAVPVGLALGGDKGAAYPINLLPEGERRVFAASRMALAGAGALAALALVLAAVTLQQKGQLDDARSDLDDQLATNQQLQAEIDALSNVQELQVQADEARTRVAAALATDVSWSRMLQEIARVIPNDVWLESFTGSVAAAATTPTTGLVAGSSTFAGIGVDFPAVAAWLQRIGTLPSFDEPWVSDATRGEAQQQGVTIESVTFQSSAVIDEDARSERSRRAREAAGLAGQPPSAPAPADQVPAAPPGGEQAP